MSLVKEFNPIQNFEDNKPDSCRVETQGGTVYWISAPESNGLRWVVREHLENTSSDTMVMHPITSSRDTLDLNEKFKARLGGDIVVGLPFVLEVSGRDTRILSEVVVNIEIGNVPELIFSGN